MTVEELKKVDPTFTLSGFISKVDNTFVLLLSAITNRDLNKVKHKLTSDLYVRYTEIVNGLIRNNEIQLYDEMNIRTTTIQLISEDDDEYFISVLLESNYMKYKIDATTKKFKSGNNKNRETKYHYLMFKKYKESKLSDGVYRCPRCGASVDINRTGACDYCHSIFNLVDYDWILTNIS